MSSDSDNERYFSLSSESYSDTSGNESFATIPSLSDTLADVFADVATNFNLVHINAQSIPAHFRDMQASFDLTNLHAILVSESWLKPCLPSISYTLPGFNLVRNDRLNCGGGGVAIYLRSHIPFSIISTSSQPPASNTGEHLFLEILLSHTKVLLGVFYSPSLHVNYFHSFETVLENLRPLYNHTIIMGDFNTCLIKQDSRASSLKAIINSSNMQILSSNPTHHFPNCAPSLLDLSIVSSLLNVAKHGQCSADAFSYHDLLFLSYKIRPPKFKPKIILQRNFSGMNQDDFLNDARNINWSPVIDADSVNNQVALFNSLLTQLYDKHAPLRAVKIKHQPAPWLTEDIKILMHKKAVAKSKYKFRPTDHNKAKYSKSRNRCNTACRDALRRHIHKSVEDVDTAKVWQFLRSIGIGKSRIDSVPSSINIDSLNSHFSSPSSISVTDKNNTLQNLHNVQNPNLPSFTFDRLSIGEVKLGVLSITSNAVGVDGISRNMVVPILDIILPVLCYVFNYSLEKGMFPAIWKDAQIIPLPKKSNPKCCADYRPISILPFLSKVLERLIHIQISKFLNRHDLLNPFQSGFRPGHSTVSSLIKITDDIRFSMENGELTVLTLLDFSNAFNTVDFDILLALLRSTNFSPMAVDWFHSYLHGRRQRVRLEENYSSWCVTSAGVPQGGVLSPLLFAFFINSISHNLSSSYHLYADDLQIYCQAPLVRINEAINTINSDLVRISMWSKAYGLRINPGKTQVILIGSSRFMCKVDWSALPHVTLDGVTIPYSDSVKNLGLLMDRTLSWAPQLQCTSRKLYAAAASMKRLQHFIPTATKIVLAQSLLLPILDYADVCYLDLTEDQLNKLERLQNFCIRFIFGLRKYDHVSQFRSRLKWLPIRLRRNTHILCLLFNILFNPSSPRYLTERFQFVHSINKYQLRSAENLTLNIPTHSSSFYDHSFTVQAVRLWNSLPISVRSAPSIHSFKTKVKQFYLNVN